MKKQLFQVLVIVSGVCIPFLATSSRVDNRDMSAYVKSDNSFILNTLTIYHAVASQCDSSPLITASNAKIDTAQLRNEKIRWMALSRNMLKRWKGEFQYGDTVLVESGDPTIDGHWIIQDTMNKRFKDRGDLLFDKGVRKRGKWKNVSITKVTLQHFTFANHISE